MAVYATGAALSAGGWTWARFRLTHIRLLRKDRLPRRLWAFLDHAHHRGVLRRAGTVYQLRHALLQDHLSSAVHAEQLQALANAGHRSAADRLADLLAQQGHTDEAITLLRARANAGDPFVADRLADLLADQSTSQVEDRLSSVPETVVI